MPNFRKMRPDLEQRYQSVLGQAQSYDPTAALTRSTQAAFEGIQPQLKRQIQGLRGEQVGMGRLTTGYGTEDEDYLIGDTYKDLNRQVAERSLQAEELGLANRQDYTDLITGGLDRGRQEEEDERARKAQGWRGFLGKLGGTVAGSFLGPVGSAVGSKLGSRLAESI